MWSRFFNPDSPLSLSSFLRRRQGGARHRGLTHAHTHTHTHMLSLSLISPIPSPDKKETVPRHAPHAKKHTQNTLSIHFAHHTNPRSCSLSFCFLFNVPLRPHSFFSLRRPFGRRLDLVHLALHLADLVAQARQVGRHFAPSFKRAVQARVDFFERLIRKRGQLGAVDFRGQLLLQVTRLSCQRLINEWRERERERGKESVSE